jgi:hypothetical protein
MKSARDRHVLKTLRVSQNELHELVHGTIYASTIHA